MYFYCCRIYVIHDEVKDKHFELELSWVGERKYNIVRNRNKFKIIKRKQTNRTAVQPM